VIHNASLTKVFVVRISDLARDRIAQASGFF
jgi:hypothetical protein